MPILYDVQRIRDGKSFTTRTVNAIQNGEYIFNMSVSFKISEKGFEHQFEMPDVPGPENLKSDREFREEMKDSIPKEMLEGILRDTPIEIRNEENLKPFANEKGEPLKNMRIKATGKLPFIKIGRSTRYDPADIKQFIEDQKILIRLTL